MRARARLLACALAAACGNSQAQAPACPAAEAVTHEQLAGLWRAEFADGGAGATLLLEPHPEYDGVRGTINRDGERSQLAGDVDAGEFTLEESVNGRNITAAWLGDVVEGSCGREIRGTWQAERDPRRRSFVLRRQ